jgi:hypothetical protein
VTDNELDQFLLEAFDARVPSEQRLRERTPAPEIHRRSPLWLALVAAAVLLVVVVPSLSPRGSPGAPSVEPAPALAVPEGMRVITTTLDPEHVADGRLAPGDVVDLHVTLGEETLEMATGTVMGSDPEGRLTVAVPQHRALRLINAVNRGAEVWPAEHAGELRLVMVRLLEPPQRPLVEGDRLIVVGGVHRLGNDLRAYDPREHSLRVLVSPEIAQQIAHTANPGHRALITSGR